MRICELDSFGEQEEASLRCPEEEIQLGSTWKRLSTWKRRYHPKRCQRIIGERFQQFRSQINHRNFSRTSFQPLEISQETSGWILGIPWEPIQFLARCSEGEGILLFGRLVFDQRWEYHLERREYPSFQIRFYLSTRTNSIPTPSIRRVQIRKPLARLPLYVEIQKDLDIFFRYLSDFDMTHFVIQTEMGDKAPPKKGVLSTFRWWRLWCSKVVENPSHI